MGLSAHVTPRGTVQQPDLVHENDLYLDLDQGVDKLTPAPADVWVTRRMAVMSYPGNNASWMADGTPRCDELELRSFRGNFWAGYPLQRPPKVPCRIQEGYQQPGDQSLFHPTLHMAGFNVTERQTVSLINQLSKCRMTVLPHNFNTCVWTEKRNLTFDRQ